MRGEKEREREEESKSERERKKEGGGGGGSMLVKTIFIIHCVIFYSLLTFQ